MKQGDIRILKRFAFFPSWIYKESEGVASAWIWFKPFYEKQIYTNWTDFEEGVGTTIKTGWTCQRQYLKEA